MEKHTFLFLEGIWQATGVFYHPDTEPVGAVGEIKVIHTKDFWINESSLSLSDPNKSRFTHNYQIHPFRKDYTFWKSYNSALGNLRGKFVIVGDTMIATYKGEEGNFNGVEYMQKIDNATYLHRGFAFKGEEKLSAWALELKMIILKEKPKND